MKHKKAFVLLISLVSCTLARPMAVRAQAPDSLRFQYSIPELATFATGDNLSNTYLISENNAIHKYDSLGRRVNTFTNKRLGSPTFLDASNPLKILVWYPDFQTLLWLDRTLNEMGRLEFSALELYAVRCVSMAFDGNIWIFDDAVSRAMKLSLDGQVLFESPPLNRYFTRRFSATRLRDSGQFVCLSDPESGFCLLDQYGNLVEAYSTLRIPDFETAGDWMFYISQGLLQAQGLGHIASFQVTLPEDSTDRSDASWLGKHRVYIQNGKNLMIYDWD